MFNFNGAPEGSIKPSIAEILEVGDGPVEEDEEDDEEDASEGYFGARTAATCNKWRQIQVGVAAAYKHTNIRTNQWDVSLKQKKTVIDNKSIVFSLHQFQRTNEVVLFFLLFSM